MHWVGENVPDFRGSECEIEIASEWLKYSFEYSKYIRPEIS